MRREHAASLGLNSMAEGWACALLVVAQLVVMLHLLLFVNKSAVHGHCLQVKFSPWKIRCQ